MKKFILQTLLIILFGVLFLDSNKKKKKRLIVRYNAAQITDLVPFVKHMSRPIIKNYEK